MVNLGISGNILCLFEVKTLPTDIKNISRFIRRVNKDGHINDIRNMYILPQACIDPTKLQEITASVSEYDSSQSQDVSVNFTYYLYGVSNFASTFETSINKITSFSGITIKNNKCFCYPYNYFTVSNNCGGMNIYKYEDFSSSNCVFENALSINVGGSGRLTPKNYKGVAKNLDESLALGKYPTCSWSGDAFTNWLTSQVVNLPTKLLNTGSSVVKSVVESGGIAGGVSTLAGEVANLIGEFNEARLLPNIEGGTNTADVMWSTRNIKFTFKGFRAKDEYIKAVDDYFSCYGYKINEVKTPNITGRTNWNYVKTIGCNIIGKENTEIPQSDINIIRKMFDNGVTLWHNPSTIYDYSQSNAIIS